MGKPVFVWTLRNLDTDVETKVSNVNSKGEALKLFGLDHPKVVVIPSNAQGRVWVEDGRDGGSYVLFLEGWSGVNLSEFFKGAKRARGLLRLWSEMDRHSVLFDAVDDARSQFDTCPWGGCRRCAKELEGAMKALEDALS